MTNKPTAKPVPRTDEQPTATHTQPAPAAREAESKNEFHVAVSPLLIVTEGGDGFCEGDSCTLPKGK